MILCCRTSKNKGTKLFSISTVSYNFLESWKSDIIGTIEFNNYSKKHRTNIGYDLQSLYWGKGYMTEVLRAVIDFGFSGLDINRIEAEVMLGNVASERLLDKLNFSKEGILRQWMFWNGQHYDMTMYSLLKSD